MILLREWTVLQRFFCHQIILEHFDFDVLIDSLVKLDVEILFYISLLS